MSGQFEFLSNSETETARLGRHFASVLTGGMMVALNGNLGAGKTNFVRAVCEGLGVSDSLVNSPTFVLMQSYTGGRLPVVHFDTYRLGDTDEFLAIGGEDYLLDPEIVCFVEWAERIAEVLPPDHITISIQHTGETSRSLTFDSCGPQGEAVIIALKATIAADELD